MKNHAVLLCNYFNFIDKEHQTEACSYIVFGKSLTEGQAAYVLRKSTKANGDKDAQHIEVWNPLTAECYVLNKKLSHSDMAFFKEDV